MKKSIFIFGILVANSINAQKVEDRNAIKSMCGCYEVKFNFNETFSYPKDKKNYKPSEKKHEFALEWIQLVEDSSDKISMQHLLIVGKDMIVKHWRQDWLFQNTKFYDYNGFENWKFKTIPTSQVAGQWTQKVYEVDDRPRYEGSATWANIDGRTFWRNTTNAPLPRREYTQRTDYNITKRTNEINIVNWGWVHNQDNDKISRNEKGEDYLLAQEKGYNTYTKVEDSKCKLAQDWWKANADFWVKVRNKWQREFDKNKDIKLHKKIDEKPLYVHLEKLNKAAKQEEIDQTIEKFIIK